MKEKLIVVAGPTAVGKTKTSIELAKALDGEIISGDSMQVYRKLDIGTAKISQEEMEGIRHHLLDIRDPDESFTAAEFQSLAQELITEINQRGKIPIIAGGTGLYIRSVTNSYSFSEAPQNLEMRNEFEKMANEKGALFLHNELQKINPERAAAIHPNNVRRVIRALEINSIGEEELKSGTSLSSSPYQLALIGLTMERENLYNRINARVDEMISQGLEKEARWLYDRHFPQTQAAQAIGYKEWFGYFNGEQSMEQAVETLKRNSRRYAKRQFTWFRNQMDFTWFSMDEKPFSEIFQEILYFAEGKLRER